MGLLAAIRRVILREHEREHAEVNTHIERADAELDAHDVRLRRLEVEKRLRSRRPGGPA